MANLLDLMRYASRGAVAKSDIDTSDEPSADFDKNHEFIREQLTHRPMPYHDPEHDELVDIPIVTELMNNKKKGPKVLNKMIDNSEYLSADDPAVRNAKRQGTDGYYNLYEQLIRDQRGNKEKL